MTGCAWEGTGLRLAITVDSNIFFANIHPKYTWCFFKRTLIFSTGLWTANGIAITFWDTHSNIVSLNYRVRRQRYIFLESSQLARSNDTPLDIVI